MPTPRTDFAIFAYDGKIYCIGGHACDENGLHISVGVNEVYDIATNSWSTKAPIPVNQAMLSTMLSVQAHIVNGKIFTMWNFGMYLYDPLSDLWTEKTNFNSGHKFFLGAVFRLLWMIK